MANRAFWESRFAQEAYVYGTEPNAFVRQVAPHLPKGRTLAVADGEGRNAVYLAQLGHEVTMWDYAQAGLEKCRRLAEARGVRVVTEWVDVTKATWPEARFDVVVCTYLHLPAPQRQAVLSHIASAVKPGGHVVMEVFSLHQLRYGTGGPEDPALLYHPAEFWFAFSAWRVRHWFWGEVERKEGQHHNGLCHVIQCWLQRPEH